VPAATLTIAGYGSHEQRLRRLTAELHLSNVEFLGRVDPERLAALYDRANIFVNSSVVDNQPVSILEAFAAGLPVVSTPTGDIASMLRDGEAGLLVPPNDPVAMATAIERLLDDPELAARTVRNAREELKKYEAARIRDQWLALYDDVRDVPEAARVAMTWNPEN